MFRKLSRFFPIKFGFINIVACSILAFFFIRFSFKNGIKPFDFSINSAFYIFYSFFTINVLIQFINTVSDRIKSLKAILNIILIFLLMGVYSYHLSTKSALHYAVIADNLDISANTDSFSVIYSLFKPAYIKATLIIILLSIAVELKFKLYSRYEQGPSLTIKALTSGTLYLAIVFIPVHTFDEVTGFIRGITQNVYSPNDVVIADGEFPYIRDRISGSDIYDELKARGLSRPNVIIIMIESYNANIVEALTPDGKEITPVINRFLKSGVYYDRFYGNSVQTVKGQEAVLLSVLPSIRGKIFRKYTDLKYRAFPSIASENGYNTVFMQGYRNLKFDNTEDIMTKSGFKIVETAYNFLSDKDLDEIWGWGPEDKMVYKGFFNCLDIEHRKNPEKPFLGIIATISNHMYFREVPREKRYLYPEPRNIKECYSNSIHLCDSQLVDFFNLLSQRSYLKNTLVIITGDHSFPINEHGFTANENGFYDESFRIPYLMIWKGVLKPERVREQVYSQLDIAPTVLDVMGLHEEKNHFLGRSLFASYDKERSVYLIQPYSGTYLGILKYPHKYIKHLTTGKEYFFNLSSDPGERYNILDSTNNNDLSLLRKDLNRIYLNQKILEMNRLWRE